MASCWSTLPPLRWRVWKALIPAAIEPTATPALNRATDNGGSDLPACFVFDFVCRVVELTDLRVVAIWSAAFSGLAKLQKGLQDQQNCIGDCGINWHSPET